MMAWLNNGMEITIAAGVRQYHNAITRINAHAPHFSSLALDDNHIARICIATIISLRGHL